MQWIPTIGYVNSHQTQPRFYPYKFSYWIVPVIFLRNVVKLDIIIVSATYRSSHWMCSVKTDLQLYLKETPTHLFSCEICEIFKNPYFEEHLRTTDSELKLWTSGANVNGDVNQCCLEKTSVLTAFNNFIETGIFPLAYVNYL